jgi:hypothetical protein
MLYTRAHQLSKKVKDVNYTKAELTEMLTIEDFPRSSSYDPVWTLENLMGLNALWLAESLSQMMDLQAGTRVLDLGCGKAISSIFLARDFQLQIWATDLWIEASDNWRRICATNIGKKQGWSRWCMPIPFQTGGSIG